MLRIVVQGKTCKDGKYRVYGYIAHDTKKPTFLEEDEPTLLALVVNHITDTDFENSSDVYMAVKKRQSFIARIVLN